MALRSLLALLVGMLATVPGAGRTSERVPPFETLRIQSAVMDEQRRVNVYLPPGYEHCSRARYPVLYLPDGGATEDFPHVISTVHRKIQRRELQPVVVVGIANTVRRRDMTGPTQAADDLKVTDEPGGAARFRTFFRNELVPIINARYRLSGESAIMGESLAGLFIVETMLAEPALFDTYIALDPSLWWNNHGLVRDAAQRLPALRGHSVRLLLAAGGAESNATSVERLASELARHAPDGLRWEYRARPDLRHDTIYRALKAPMLAAVFPADSDSGVVCGEGGS